MIRVIGCGQRDRRDDGLGLVAAERLRTCVPAGVDVLEAFEPLRVLDLLDGAGTVILIDAVRDPARVRTPGSLVRIEAGDDVPGELRTSLSTHGVGLAEALGLAFALGQHPHVIVHGIEVADVDHGEGLSEPVTAALPALVDAVLTDVVRARRTSGSRP